MNDGLIKQQAGQALGGQITGNRYAAAREKAQGIVDSMVAMHSRELSGWQWLKIALEKVPPNDGEEAALWEIVCRARRERY